MRLLLWIGLSAAALMAVTSQGALAQSSVFDIEASASAKSDYVYRGLSRTGSDFVGQGGVDLVHSSGFYLGGFISTLGDRQGRDFELETHVGYSFSSGAYDIDLRISYDRLEGGENALGYVDFQGSVSRDYGLAYVTGGLAMTPDNREIGGGGSVYVFGEAEFPLPIQRLPPTSLAFHAGYEDYQGNLNKWDWSVALYMEVRGIELGLGYYDTDLGNVRDARARVVFSVGKYF